MNGDDQRLEVLYEEYQSAGRRVEQLITEADRMDIDSIEEAADISHIIMIAEQDWRQIADEILSLGGDLP